MAAVVTTVWLGTAGWSYFPDWVGPFYPAGTRPADALERYTEAFRFVEVDSTFYAAPAPETVERWAELMPADFRVAVKAPRALVQETGLHPPDAAFDHFCRVLLAPLASRLARVVVQMPPSFDRRPEHDVALRAFCSRWAAEVPLAIELRDPSWLVEPVRELMAVHDVAWVCNDIAGMPRVAVRTARSCAYVRLIGSHDGIRDTATIQRPQPEGRQFWVDQVHAWAVDDIEDVYITVNNHYEGHAPATARALADALHGVGVDLRIGAGHPEGQLPLF
ncbi:MAG: hypothetical protein JWO37_3018 [Acidimicrobiales bacterium]|nr:hypothetical protein [Acidimicrobiales bacterium]